MPVAQQVRLRQLGGADGGVVAKNSGTKIAILLGFVVLILWCLLVLYVSRIREQMRAPDRSGRDVVDEFDEFDEDMRRLLRARAAAGPSERRRPERRSRQRRPRQQRPRKRRPRNGGRENGGRKNGARAILPYGIEDDDDEDAADRPGSAPVRDR